MKILLGNHQLDIRAGSELFTAELAFALKHRGHDVAVFTFFKGEQASEIEARGISVFDPDDVDAMNSFAPDIIQTCHIPCAHFLRIVAPHAVRVHAMLGVLSPLEGPPLDASAFTLGLAVSEEVLEQVHRSTFGRQVEVVLFPNWFDDAAVKVARSPTWDKLKRVAGVSNHIAPDLVVALKSLEAAGEVSVEYFGVQHKSVVVDGLLLGRFHLVISIGRTSLLAAACGIPCIMADIHGSDGLLTFENFDRVSRSNFSGRLARHSITTSHLQEEMGKQKSAI